MRDETSLLNPRNANPKLSAVVRDVKQRMWPDRVFSPDGAQPRQDLCLRSVSTILNRDLSSYLDEKVVEHHWRCRLPRRFHALLAQPEVCSCRVTGSLAELFDCLSARAENRRLKQLGNIYHRRLLPLIGRYFEARARAQLEESLKTLMLFQYLDMPYRGYDMGRDPTSSGVLMMKLHMLCGGRGLMTWREDATVLFAIEGDRERFVTWVMGRMCCFEDRDARCKVLSDALWSTLFAEAHNDTLDERCVWMESGRSFSISGAQFPTRDAISIHIRGNGSDVPHTVVFESPWMQDRGCRLQRTLRALPLQSAVLAENVDLFLNHPLERKRNEIKEGIMIKSAVVTYPEGLPQLLKMSDAEFGRQLGFLWPRPALRVGQTLGRQSGPTGGHGAVDVSGAPGGRGRPGYQPAR